MKIRKGKTLKTQWIFGFQRLGCWAWSLGIHIDPFSPNIEIHLPFGFLRVGRYHFRSYTAEEMKQFDTNLIGWESEWKDV